MPQDVTTLDTSKSGLTHAVTLYTPAGDLSVGTVEIINPTLLDWQRRPSAHGAVITVWLIGAGKTEESLKDPRSLAALEECQPVIFALECELDADLVAEALRGHLARLNASHGRH